MKLSFHFFIIIMLTGLVYFITACSTTSDAKITMADASVPVSKQSLIVVLNTNGNWMNAKLVSIDDTQLNVPGSMFYIPSGLRKLNFETTSSSVEYEYKKNVRIDTTYTQTSGLQITETFLPGHTYRMVMRNSSNIKLEDITGSVKWLPPKVSISSPKNGVLTNFTVQRGPYMQPVLNGGPYLQYTHQFDGRDAQILGWQNDILFYADKGVTGLSPVLVGMFFQGGLDLVINKVGLTVMAEINGGIGFAGDIYGMDYDFIGLNCGYLFVGELYYLNAIGVGFGYGVSSMVPSLTSDFMDLIAYDYLLPYFRGEVIFFPKSIVPITIFGNYFFEHDKWAFGILANFSQKRERVFSSKILE